ncbi:MAG: EpsI family protein [Candidatus Marinimicrobia bacterium]|nr:EpsI family protein [Candidatus Neomarinimicrobiota bacterium]
MKAQGRYIIVYLLLSLTALFIYTHETVAVPVNRPLTEIPTSFDEWTMVCQSRFSQDVLKQLRPTDYLYRVYKDTQGNKVTLYLGYHAGGPDSGPIHSPKNCLPGSGWFELSEVNRGITVAGKDLPIVQAVYQNDSQKEVFLYFFQVKGQVLTDEYSLKLSEIINSILYNRRDAAFIRISVPFYDDQAAAVTAGENFLIKVYPHIVSVLPM